MGWDGINYRVLVIALLSVAFFGGNFDCILCSFGTFVCLLCVNLTNTAMKIEYANTDLCQRGKELHNNNGEKSYKCNQCIFTSSTAGNLRKHLTRHNGEREQQASHLRVHLKRHLGEKSHKCNQCNFLSSFSGGLKTHVKRHSGEKSHKCNQCDDAFSVECDLRAHLKRDSGEKTLKCKQCDFSSFYTGFLRLHMKTHIGEKSNKCNQCEYASSHADSLRTHLKTHSGEKPWKCSQCDFASSYSHHLRLHLKSHIDGEKTNKRRDIWIFILEEIYINVICVIMQPHKQFTLKHIWKHTAERNHTNVPSVSMHPLIYAIWGNICTVGAKNRTYATNASLPLMNHVRWWFICEYTVVASQTNAANAIMHPIRKAIWRAIWKLTVEKRITNATNAIIKPPEQSTWSRTWSRTWKGTPGFTSATVVMMPLTLKMIRGLIWKHTSMANYFPTYKGKHNLGKVKWLCPIWLRSKNTSRRYQENLQKNNMNDYSTK